MPTSDLHAAASEAPLSEIIRARVSALLVAHPGTPIEGLYPVIMREVERSLLETVITSTAGRKDEAARILGLHRNSLRLRLRAVGLLDPPRRKRTARRRGARS